MGVQAIDYFSHNFQVLYGNDLRIYIFGKNVLGIRLFFNVTDVFCLDYHSSGESDQQICSFFVDFLLEIQEKYFKIIDSHLNSLFPEIFIPPSSTIEMLSAHIMPCY